MKDLRGHEGSRTEQRTNLGDDALSGETCLTPVGALE